MVTLKPQARVLLLSTHKEVLMGVYSATTLELLRTYQSQKPISQSLLALYAALEKSYEVSAFYYSRGPGSLMGLKLIYLFAKTLNLAKQIPIFAAHSFCFNDRSPIKAYGKVYCVWDTQKSLINEEYLPIALQFYENPPFMKDMELPSILPLEIFSDNILEPLYLNPPV